MAWIPGLTIDNGDLQGSLNEDATTMATTTGTLHDVEHGVDAKHSPAQIVHDVLVRTTLFSRIKSYMANGTSGKRVTDPFFTERIREIHKQPSGYPKLATFMDSDPSFMVYRRFGYARQRLLLYWQDIVREKEKALDDLDRAEGANEAYKKALWDRKGDDGREGQTRRNLILGLGNALRDYDDVLYRTAKSYRFKDPSLYNRTDVENAIRNDDALAIDDRSFLEHTDDLIALAGDNERTRVHEFFEKIFFGANKPLSRYIFRTRVQQIKMEGSGINLELYSTERMNKVVTSFFVLVIVALLMIPTFTLHQMESHQASGFSMNGAILGFTSAFALLCSTCTSAKRHEVFAATAAYCAVLVVFISQGSPPGNK